MNKIILFFASILFFAGVANGQSLTTPSWAWGKDFNLSSTAPPLMTYKDSFVYIAGNYDSTLHLESNIYPHSGGKDIYLAKFNTSGVLIWAKVISQLGNQIVAGIQVNNNEVVIAGSYDSPFLQIGTTIINSVGGSDLFIAKYDTSGNNTALYNYGNIGNDNVRSLALDYNNNIYLAGDSLYKFSNSGTKIWDKPYPANHIYYSKIDSTIVMDGYATYGLDVRKITLNGNSLWGGNPWGVGPGNPTYYGYFVGFNENDGNLFIGYSYYWNIGLDNYCYLYHISPNGNQILLYTYNDINGAPGGLGVTNISANNNYVMFTLNNYTGTHLYNYSTNTLYKDYNYMPLMPNSYKFVDTNMIFAHGDNGISNHTFGKFGNDTIAVTSYHIPHACLGSTKNINSSVIIGGTPPYSYSWLPTTGLSSTNTLNTSLVANSNITYTLTVTDANGLIFSKPYDIIIDSPNVTVNITSQFPVLCDSMFLYSNPGLNGYWYKKVGNYWTYLSMAQNLKIYTSGKYKFVYGNNCGNFTDSIEILTVNSNSLTNLSICSNQFPYAWNGQSLTNGGVYTYHTPNAAGCDSIATLSLTINQSISTTNVSVCSNQLPYSWNGQSLTSGGVYTYQTTNSVGCDSIATLNLSISNLCCTLVSYISMSFIGSNSGTCIWSSSTGTTGYNLRYREVGTTTWNNISNIIGHSQTLSGLTPCTQYEFQIQKICQNNLLGDFSASKLFTTKSICTVVNGLTLTTISSNSGNTKWNTAQGALSYNLRYKELSSSTWITIPTNITATNYLITGLNSGTTYEFQISTNCNSGTGCFSASKQFTTSNCDVVNGLTMSMLGATTATAIWTNSPSAISYNLRYKLVMSSNSWIYVNSINTSSYTFSNLQQGKLYECQVSQVCNGGVGDYSVSTQFATSPIGLTLSSWANTYGAVQWNKIFGIPFYDLRYKVVGSSTWILITGVTNTNYIITGLMPSTQYEFQVKANISTFSNSKLFTTSSNCASTYDNNLNSSIATAQTIPLLTPIYGVIENSSDVDFYKIISSNSADLYISLTNLPADYKLSLLDATQNIISSSNNSGANSEFILFSYPLAGIYYVKVEGVMNSYNQNQCYTLKVNNNGSYKQIESDDIETEFVKNITIYPNPTDNILTIDYDLEKTSNVSIRLLDMTGKVISNITNNENQSKGNYKKVVNLKSLSISEGMYMLQLSDGVSKWNQRIIYKN